CPRPARLLMRRARMQERERRRAGASTISGKRRGSSFPGRLYLLQPFAAGRQLIGFWLGARRGGPRSRSGKLVAPDAARPRWHPARRPLGGGFSGLGRLIDLHEAAVLHIVNVAVDRDVLRHQRMITDAHNVVNHASGEVADRMPFDELAIDRARALADVAPA